MHDSFTIAECNLIQEDTIFVDIGKKVLYLNIKPTNVLVEHACYRGQLLNKIIKWVPLLNMTFLVFVFLVHIFQDILFFTRNVTVKCFFVGPMKW